MGVPACSRMTVRRVASRSRAFSRHGASPRRSVRAVESAMSVNGNQYGNLRIHGGGRDSIARPVYQANAVRERAAFLPYTDGAREAARNGKHRTNGGAGRRLERTGR